MSRLIDRSNGPTSGLLSAPEDILFILGLIASGVNLVALMQARKLSSGYDDELVKTTIFYISHLAQIIFLMAAGVIAFFRKMRRSGNTNHRLAFGAYILALIAMTINGYSFNDLFSLKIVAATGPMPLLMSLLLYVGAWRRDWRLHDFVFKWVGLFTTLAIVFNVISLPSSDRIVVESYLWGYMQVYIWVVIWFFFRPSGKTRMEKVIRWGPFILYVLVAILQQGRSRIIWSFLILVGYFYAIRRNNQSLVTGSMSLLLSITIFILIVMLFADESNYMNMFNEAGNALINRIDEDSRSDQFIKFFEEVSPWELVLGRGAMATWTWNRVVERTSLDNWWMTALFIGGIPLVVGYFWVHVIPAWRRFKTAKNINLVCAFIVLLWCVKLLLSEAPYFMLNTYLVLLCLGPCLAPPLGVNGMRNQVRR